MAPNRAAGMSEEEEFAEGFDLNARSGVVPDPGTHIRRDWTPKGSKIPGLEEMVWKSYTEGETVVLSVPPHKVDFVKDQLLAAKNFLNHQHRDDEETVDIRGLEKHNVQVVNPSDIRDPKERAAYRKIVRDDEVGVRFKARRPFFKGQAVRKAKRHDAASRSSDPATRAVPHPPDKPPTSRSATTKESIKNAIPQVPFSG